MDKIKEQKRIFDLNFSDAKKFEFHITKDPFTRFVRDRRLNYTLKYIEQFYSKNLTKLSVLVVCGGPGGEAYFFLKWRDLPIS